MKKILETLRRKWADYLLEVLVITIGILGAFMLNNWNEDRKNSNTEEKALIDLKNEFEQNNERLLRVVELKRKAEFELRNYIRAITSDSLSITDKSQIERPDIAGYAWFSDYSVLNSLLSTGKIDNLKNDSLKYLLTGWITKVSAYSDRQSIYNKITLEKLFDFEGQFLPSKIFKKEGGQEYIFEDDMIKLRSNIISDIRYQNLLTRTANQVSIQLFNGESTLELSSKIQKLLNQEIGRKN